MKTIEKHFQGLLKAEGLVKNEEELYVQEDIRE